MKRDNAIDFFRGFAALWIIVIHTVCKSGSSYVPGLVLNLVLIIDVAIFIFISGMSFNYQKSVNKVLTSLKKVYLSYLKFLILYWALVLVFDRDYVTIENIINSLFFKFDIGATFYVVKESMWFLPMYFVVSLLSALIITSAEKNEISIPNILFIIFVFYGCQLYFIKIDIPFISEILLYMFVYILGYYLYKNKLRVKSKIIFLVFFVLLNIILLTFANKGFSCIANLKFEFDLVYLVYQMISIFALLLIYEFIYVKKNNPLCIIGRNAILCYFAQGISSSLMNYIVKLYNFNWVIKLLISIIINIIICLIITLFLYYLFKLMDKFFIKFKKLILNNENI